VSPDTLLSYPDENAAQNALDEGVIDAYYVVHEDYLETGEISYVRPDYNPVSAVAQSGLINWVLRLNLLDGDTALAAMVNGPLSLEEVSLASEPQRDEDNPLTFFLPYTVTILFYIIIFGAASLLLGSVTKEKENRVIESLMMSITPRQMLTGKIIALGLVGLLQAVIWIGTGRALLFWSGSTFNLPGVFQLPVSILVWGLVFFVLGYAVYASLMAGLGALVPNLREASQVTFLIALPTIIPLFFISIMVEEPNGTLATGLSLFPLTAPVAMMTRMAAGNVPIWQAFLSAVLLGITAFFIIRAVARMFRAQNLLSGQPFKLNLLLGALFEKK
jgi:ABC-2 type transport system permease protein